MNEGPCSAAPPPVDAQTHALESLAHDLRSALNPIVLWSHLALDPSISEEERVQRIRTVEGAAKRMADLIETIPCAAIPSAALPAPLPTTTD